jgi:hypothetical protein
MSLKEKVLLLYERNTARPSFFLTSSPCFMYKTQDLLPHHLETPKTYFGLLHWGLMLALIFIYIERNYHSFWERSTR